LYRQQVSKKAILNQQPRIKELETVGSKDIHSEGHTKAFETAFQSECKR